MADRLELEARFNDKASAGVKKLGKTLGEVKPSNGMQAATVWMKDFRGAAEKANVAVRPVTTTLTALGIGGLAASMSLGEIVKQMRDLADSTLTMKELGRQSGLTATEISRLQYAAGKLHVDPAAVSGAIGSWSSQMLDFRKTTSEFYRYLLVQNADVAAKIKADGPEQGFEDTLDYISRIPAAAMKAGKSAADAAQIQKRVADMAGVGDMVPALAKGPEGWRAAMSDAVREVKPISAEMQAAAEKLNDSTNRMNQSWTNLKNDIGPSVIGPLTQVIDRLDETLKLAAAHPGDAAAVAGVGVLSAVALFARRRIMAGSKLAGGAGLDRAAGELTGAAGALKQAAAALEGKGVGGPGGPGVAPGEGKPSSGSFNSGRGILAALGLAGAVVNAPGMDAAGDRERDANASGLESFGEMARKALGVDWLQGKVDEWRKGGATAPSAGGARQLYSAPAIEEDRATRARDVGGPARPSSREAVWSAPSAYDREVRARRGSTSDDRPVTALPTQELFATVKQGSKEGIIAGLREMAQQDELGNGGLGAGDPIKGWASGIGGGKMHSAAESVRYNRQHTRGSGGGSGPVAPFHLDGNQSKQLGDGIRLASQHLGIDPKDLATAISYETGGTMDPWKPGPHTKWGWHHGLIQWGEPQAKQYGVSAKSTIGEQMAAVEHYMRDAGVKPGMGMKDVYSAINAGHVGKYNASDRPGMTVSSHVDGMLHSAHRAALDRLDRQAGSPSGPSPAAQSAADLFKARQKALQGAPPEAHAAGGAIRGPGGPRSDGIPAWLSNGEFVVNAQASGQWLPFLEHINAGKGAARGMAPSRSSGRALPTPTMGTMPRQMDLEAVRSLPNIVRLANESTRGTETRVEHGIDPVEVNIRHHPHTGHPIVTARAGKGVRLGIRTAPMMRPT